MCYILCIAYRFNTLRTGQSGWHYAEFFLRHIHLEMFTAKHKPFCSPLNTTKSWYRWFSARLQYLQCISNGETAVLHWGWAIDIYCQSQSWLKCFMFQGFKSGMYYKCWLFSCFSLLFSSFQIQDFLFSLLFLFSENAFFNSLRPSDAIWQNLVC